MIMLTVSQFRSRCIFGLSGAMPDWSLEPRAMPSMHDQRGTYEGLLASIDVAESTTSTDGSFGIIVEVMKLIVTVRTAPQLAKQQTDPALDEGFDGSREAQHEQRLGHICMWYEIIT